MGVGLQTTTLAADRHRSLFNSKSKFLSEVVTWEQLLAMITIYSAKPVMPPFNPTVKTRSHYTSNHIGSGCSYTVIKRVKQWRQLQRWRRTVNLDAPAELYAPAASTNHDWRTCPPDSISANCRWRLLGRQRPLPGYQVGGGSNAALGTPAQQLAASDGHVGAMMTIVNCVKYRHSDRLSLSLSAVSAANKPQQPILEIWWLVGDKKEKKLTGVYYFRRVTVTL